MWFKSHKLTTWLSRWTLPLNFGVPDKSPYQNGSFHYRVYFRKFIPVQTEISKYPFESFVAEVGGYLGLLLGVSILDFLNVPDTLFNFFRRAHANNKYWNTIYYSFIIFCIHCPMPIRVNEVHMLNILDRYNGTYSFCAFIYSSTWLSLSG